MIEDVLDTLVALSRELGRPEHALVILGEGNTSARLEDGTFFIKGSGSQLATIEPGQFSRVRTEPVLRMLEEPHMEERGVEAALRAALVDPRAPRPSIETMLHALCLTEGGASFVGHTHAESVNQVLCSRHGAEPFKEHIFPDAIVVCGRVPLIVPYVDPGLPLAVACRDALRDYGQAHRAPPKLVLLVNHGIIALGQSPREVLNITLMAQKWARVLVGALQLGGPRYLSADSVDAIDSRLDEDYRRKQLST